MYLSNKDKLTLFESLHTMLSAGIPISDALETIKDGASNKQTKVLVQMETAIKEGKSISKSLESQNKLFDPVTINLLNSGEKSGNLTEVLLDIVNHIKREVEFTSKIKSAMMYPLMVFGLFLGILVVILTYVMPRISTVFSKLDVVIPLPTRILIITSEFFTQNWLYITIIFFVLILIIVFLIIFKKRWLTKIISTFPFIKKLFITIDIARLFRNFDVMLSAGIPINEVIKLSKKVVSNKKVVSSLNTSEKYILEGKSLFEGLSEYKKVYGNLTVKILQSGELSGSLEDSFKSLAVEYDEKVSKALKALTTILEPLMLITIALFVGGIMLSIIAPIYQMIGNIT